MAPRKTTLLDLLLKLQSERPVNERVLVQRAVRMLRNGRVVLCGTYAGTRMK